MSKENLIVERAVTVPMRDGVSLRADIYRLEGDERRPTLLQRTPYGRRADAMNCMASAERGFLVIAQDCRGCGASDGYHYPFREEFDDGYDSVEWSASLPWSNGNVGMWGGSYVGWTQWAAAATNPPSLKAIFPTLTFMDLYGDLLYPQGAMALGTQASWFLGAVAPTVLSKLDLAAEKKERLSEEIAKAIDGLSSGVTYRLWPDLPFEVTTIDEISRCYHDMIAHPRKDAYWQEMDIRSRVSDLSVPAYHVGGWYDIFTHGTLANFQSLCNDGANPRARRGQKLIMGPWLHGPAENPVGEVDFGYAASDRAVGSLAIMWRWFDYWLDAKDNGIMDEPPIRIYVMGKNEWRNESEWPLARTCYEKWYLHSEGKANSLRGDGRLTTDGSLDEPADAFTYDPENPVPTRGGGLCCSATSLRPGAFDQRSIEEREDVLVYTSAPFDEPFEITGPVSVKVWMSTSAPDTDVTAKLVDVYASGYARNLCDGTCRLALRDSLETESPVPANTPVQATIDLAATSNVVLPGHRLRIEISSSNFPRFRANPNTGQSLGRGEYKKAFQQVYHDAGHPSYVLLPVIPQPA